MSLELDELSTTLKVWYHHQDLLNEKEVLDSVTQAVVDAFNRSASFLEPKIYLLMELLVELSYEQINTLLSALEERFGNI